MYIPLTPDFGQPNTYQASTVQDRFTRSHPNRSAVWIDQLPNNLSEIKINWLQNPSSLTTRLERLTDGQATLRLTKESTGYPTREEAILLHLSPYDTAYIRESAWYYKNKLWIKNRVIIPTKILHTEPVLRHLFGNHKPIGKILFSGSYANRSPFEFKPLLTPTENTLSKANTWMRRSVFFKHATDIRLLIVQETFLPAFFKHIQQMDRSSDA